MLYLFPIQSIQLFDHSCLQFYSFSDISKNLLKWVRSLLIQEHTNSLSGFHPTTDDGHQLGPHKILVLLCLSTIAAGQRLRCFLVGWCLHIDRPIGVHILGILHLLEKVVRWTDVTFPFWKKKMKTEVIIPIYDDDTGKQNGFTISPPTFSFHFS